MRYELRCLTLKHGFSIFTDLGPLLNDLRAARIIIQNNALKLSEISSSHGATSQKTVIFVLKLVSILEMLLTYKARRMRWAGHVARMGEVRGAYNILVGRPEGSRPLGRPRRRWEDNIKMDIREIGFGDVDWIHLAQGRDRSRALVKTVMNLRVP
jgi:hypothetical protein